MVPVSHYNLCSHDGFVVSIRPHTHTPIHTRLLFKKVTMNNFRMITILPQYNSSTDSYFRRRSHEKGGLSQLVGSTNQQKLKARNQFEITSFQKQRVSEMTGLKEMNGVGLKENGRKGMGYVQVESRSHSELSC